MTASTASNTRSVSGARRLIGRRAIVALAIGASATLGLSACGAGQIAQTSSQAPGVTGSEGMSANGLISVHDVQLLYPSQEDALEQNLLQISFTAVNTDPVNADTLESITVNGHELTLADGDFAVRPKGAIATPELAAFSTAARDLAGEQSSPASTSTPAETTTSDDGDATESTTSTPAPTTSAAATSAAPAADSSLPSRVTVNAVDNAKVGEVGESVTVVFKFANAGVIEIPTPLAVWHDVPRRAPDTTAATHD